MAVHAESNIQLNTIPAQTSLLGGHFVYFQGNTGSGGNTPASANVIADSRYLNIPAQWGYNTHIGANGIKLRYNENDLSSWTSQGISIYNPITHNATMQLTGQALNFYNPNNDRLSLSLNSNGLNFYGSSIVNPDASLTTTGLVLSKGGIQTGTSGQNGFVYLSSEDYQRKDATHSGITINGHTPTAAGTDDKTIDDPAWREIIGTKFGVDSEGNLYANNANITGAIVATSLDLTTNNVQISTNNISGLASVATSGSYNDLSNKPTIPSLTNYIYKDGTIGSTPGEGATGFVVSSQGLLTASNAIIYGTIYASTGIIGGWNIGTDTNKSLYYGNLTPGATSTNLVISTSSVTNSNAIAGSTIGKNWFISAGQNFGVDTSGNLYASNAHITGEIKADTGRIGGANGWTINTQQISSGSLGSNNSMYLATKNLAGTVANTTLSSNGPSWRLTVGSGFGVDNNGKLYATGAKINGDIVATSLTIGSGASSYSGIAAINATNYDIEIVNDINSLPQGYTANNNNTYLYPIIYHNGVNVRDEFIDSPDTTINSNKIYYTRALVDGAYVYTRVDSPVVADINSYYERVYPFNKFIWYEGNNAIGAAGDVYNGGIVVEYGKIYRVVYSFSDDEVGEAQTTQTIYIDDTKYITKISDTGITIHPENSSGNNYLQITSSDVEIIKNGESLAQFGANGSRIGAYNAGRIVTSPNELAGYMTNGVRYFTMLENGGEVETYTYMAIWESDIDNSVTIDLSTDQRTRYYWSTVNASEGAIPITFVYHFTNGDPMNGRTRIFNLSITKGTATSNSHFTYDGINTLIILSYKPTVTNPGQWTWTLYGKEISANHITNTTGPFFQFGTDEEELTHTAAYSMSIGKSVSTGPYGLAVGKYNEYHEHDAFSIGGGSNSTYGRYTVFAVDSGGGISAPAYVGLITLVASSTEIPNGWLRCDGDTWEITRYPELYDMIGTNFGTASSGYFKVPTLTAPSGMTYLIYTGRSQTHTIDGVIQS